MVQYALEVYTSNPIGLRRGPLDDDEVVFSAKDAEGVLEFVLAG